ncbi:MAG: Rieske 2Fe-2S domain-containing protein, partial [Burkholderiales bacterium]
MSPEDDQIYSQVSRNSPMGALLRRYWIPALLSDEAKAGAAPVRVRLLGEDLIAYRSANGDIGLLDEKCAHRGSSLYFAHNEADGLRCWYHGWKYATSGQCLEMPNEPRGADLLTRMRQLAYPCRERNGVVWAYMGPAENMPEMPHLEYLQVAPTQHYVSKRIQDCHWTQGMEGDLDPSHIAHLHGNAFSAREAAGPQSNTWIREGMSPIVEIEAHGAGVMFAARRDAGDDKYFWRVAHWFAPFFTMVPAHPGAGPLFGHAWVPRDEHSSSLYTFTWHPQRALTDEERRGFLSGERTHAELIPGTHQPARNRSNAYVDPAAADAAQPWMRITRIQDQDIAVTESIGAHFDRSEENLGASDAVIARVRRTLLEAARSVDSGLQLPGSNPLDYRRRQVS